MFGLLFEISLCCDAIDFCQITCVKHFTENEVLELFLLASFFLICVDHVQYLHSLDLALLAIFANYILVYVFMVELLAQGASWALR